MTELERQRAIRLRLARSEHRSGGVLPTGFVSLDSALGGGFPSGTIVELFGPSSIGKTTLALQIVAHCQKNRATAAWIDADHAFDAPYAAGLGVKVEELPLVQPESAEQAFAIARQLIDSKALDLLVVDSAAALVPKLELETGVNGGAGLHSRVLASGLRRLAWAIRKTSATALFLNQTRSHRQATGGDAEGSAGGAPLKLYASLRIVLESRGSQSVRFRMLKNKAGGASRAGELRCQEHGRFMESL